MEYLNTSFFVALLVRFWDRLTELFRGGIFHRMAMAIWARTQRGLCFGFAIGGDFADKLWQQSALYRLLSRLMQLPISLSRRLFGGSNALSRSFIVGETLEFAENRLHPVCGFFMMALLIIPQSMWNNLYSLLGAVAIMALFILAAAGTDRSLSLREIGFFPVFFAFCVCLAFVMSQQRGLSFRFLLFHLTCMVLVPALVNAPRSSRELEKIVLIASLGLAVCSAYALVQRIVGVEADKILTDLTVNAGMPGRVYSFFENPNSFANILVLFAPLMLCMALYAPGGIRKLWYLGVFGLCSLALIMTYSRGGWLSLAFGLGIMLMSLGPRWVPLCVVLCICCIPFLPDSILNRLLTMFNSGDSSIYTRGYIYTAMGRLIGLYPIFGVGLGAAAVKHAIEANAVYEAEALFVHGHNIYLQIWGEMGVFGLIAFLGSMVFAVRTGLGMAKNADPILRGIAVGAACSVCGSLFFGITDYAWSYPRVMVMFWFVFALIPACVRLRNIK